MPIDFKNIRLTIELIPETSFYTNLRSELADNQWDYIRQAVYKRANYQCEICGGKGKKHPVEAHEEWDFDELNGVQRLEKVVALCPDCHQVKHIGFAEIIGKKEEALAHLAKINGWTQEDTEVYLSVVWMYWEHRSTKEWTLNIKKITDWLEAKGIEPDYSDLKISRPGSKKEED